MPRRSNKNAAKPQPAGDIIRNTLKITWQLHCNEVLKKPHGH